MMSAYAELLRGLRESPASHLSRVFEQEHDDAILVRDIEFYSLCEHHLLPFTGKAHIAYIPKDKVVGLSKLARLVDMYAKRLQIQEKMTAEIAKALTDVLQPKGVAVVIDATHMCMTMRGVRKPGATTVTSAVRGLFRDSAATRFEAMRYIDGR